MNNCPRPATALASASYEDDTMKEAPGDRRRWCRVRSRRTGVLAVMVGLALLTAACGGISSSTGTGSALSRFVADELAFARCLRAHGVSDYPDPQPNGQYPPVNKRKIASNPHFPAANRACSHLIPESAITALNQADMRKYVRFAVCMRAHGVQNFPDPAAQPNGRPIFNLTAAGVLTHSPRVLGAALKCQSLLHLSQLPEYE